MSYAIDSIIFKYNFSFCSTLSWAYSFIHSMMCQSLRCCTVSYAICWDTTHYGSLIFLLVLQARALAVLVLGSLFKDACMVNSLWKQITYLSLEQKVGLFIVQCNKDAFIWNKDQTGLPSIIKDSSSLSLSSSFVRQSNVWTGTPISPYVNLWKFGFRELRKCWYSGYCSYYQ